VVSCADQAEVVRQEVRPFSPPPAGSVVNLLNTVHLWLLEEEKIWLDSKSPLNGQTTWEHVSKYQSAVAQLTVMLRHGAFLAFVMGFQTFEISPKGIRDCFRARPGVIGQKDTEYRRNQSNKVLVTVGRRIVDQLSTAAMIESAKTKRFDREKALAYINAIVKEGEEFDAAQANPVMDTPTFAEQEACKF